MAAAMRRSVAPRQASRAAAVGPESAGAQRQKQETDLVAAILALAEEDLAGAGADRERARLGEAVRGLFARLPIGPTGQPCIDDALSYVRACYDATHPAPPAGPVSGQLGVAIANAPAPPGGPLTSPIVNSASGLPFTGPRRLAAIGNWMRNPEFAESIADLGKLPDRQYVLVFDPHAHQYLPPPHTSNNQPPPAATLQSNRGGVDLRAPSHTAPRPSGLIPPVAGNKTDAVAVAALAGPSRVAAVGGAGGGLAAMKDDGEVQGGQGGRGLLALDAPDGAADLRSVDGWLSRLFEEELTGSATRCGKCKESRFLSVSDRQTRAADEGSSLVYHCRNCGHFGIAR